MAIGDELLGVRNSSSSLVPVGLAHRLRSDLPVILCTGYADSISEADVRAGAIDKVLLKPFELPLFAEMIREVLEGSKLKGARSRTALELYAGR